MKLREMENDKQKQKDRQAEKEKVLQTIDG